MDVMTAPAPDWLLTHYASKTKQLNPLICYWGDCGDPDAPEQDPPNPAVADMRWVEPSIPDSHAEWWPICAE